LHVVDAGAKDMEAHITSVNNVLQSLALDQVPQVLIFNKCDQLPTGQAEALCWRYGAIGISALHPETLPGLISHLEERLSALVPMGSFPQKSAPSSGTLASRP